MHNDAELGHAKLTHPKSSGKQPAQLGLAFGHRIPDENVVRTGECSSEH